MNVSSRFARPWLYIHFGEARHSPHDPGSGPARGTPAHGPARYAGRRKFRSHHAAHVARPPRPGDAALVGGRGTAVSRAASDSRSHGPRAARSRCRTRCASTWCAPALSCGSKTRAPIRDSKVIRPRSMGSSRMPACRSLRRTATSSAPSAPSSTRPRRWSEEELQVLRDAALVMGEIALRATRRQLETEAAERRRARVLELALPPL